MTKWTGKPQGLRVVRKHLPPVPRDKRMKTSSQLTQNVRGASKTGAKRGLGPQKGPAWRAPQPQTSGLQACGGVILCGLRAPLCGFVTATPAKGTFPSRETSGSCHLSSREADSCEGSSGPGNASVASSSGSVLSADAVWFRLDQGLSWVVSFTHGPTGGSSLHRHKSGGAWDILAVVWSFTELFTGISGFAPWSQGSVAFGEYLVPPVLWTLSPKASGIPDSPGKSGLVSRGSKVLRFPLESRRVPIERTE